MKKENKAALENKFYCDWDFEDKPISLQVNQADTYNVVFLTVEEVEYLVEQINKTIKEYEKEKQARKK